MFSFLLLPNEEIERFKIIFCEVCISKIFLKQKSKIFFKIGHSNLKLKRPKNAFSPRCFGTATLVHYIVESVR